MHPNDPSSLNEEITLSPMPLPSDPKTIFLGGLFILAFLTALRVASAIILPVVLAFLLKLVLQPAMRFLESFRLPRTIAALLILLILLITVIGLGTVLSGPAAAWAQKMPSSISKLQEQFGFVSKPIASAERIMAHAEDLTNGIGPKVQPVAIEGSRLSDRIFAGTQAMISAVFTTVLVLFYLLISGDTFLRRLVEILPRFKDKRQAVDISQHIEQDISAYLVTITILNAIVGVVTWGIMLACGIEDPILWGILAFLLNYIPIIGPIFGVAIFILVGLLTTNNLQMALLPAILYLIVHILEGTLGTPFLLAKRFTLNPVLVVLSLVFWYWMWGLPGVILAMPMLAITKIICDRVHKLNAFGHFLEG